MHLMLLDLIVKRYHGNCPIKLQAEASQPARATFSPWRTDVHREVSA